jgi:hypothetical protein
MPHIFYMFRLWFYYWSFIAYHIMVLCFILFCCDQFHVHFQSWTCEIYVCMYVCVCVCVRARARERERERERTTKKLKLHISQLDWYLCENNFLPKCLIDSCLVETLCFRQDTAGSGMKMCCLSCWPVLFAKWNAVRACKQCALAVFWHWLRLLSDFIHCFHHPDIRT